MSHLDPSPPDDHLHEYVLDLMFGAALFVAGLLVLIFADHPWWAVGPVISIAGAGWFVNVLRPPKFSSGKINAPDPWPPPPSDDTEGTLPS